MNFQHLVAAFSHTHRRPRRRHDPIVDVCEGELQLIVDHYRTSSIG